MLKLKIHMGLGGTVHQVRWYKPVAEFPKLVSHDGKVWEWIYYDNDTTGSFDHILHFGELRHYDPADHSEEPHPFSELTETWNTDQCECGAIYDRDFPHVHSFWCKKWKKI